MVLTKVAREFVLHWGEMGSRWGVNRTVAQVHALLYLSLEPLTAEVVAEALAVARSNVSSSLRDLQGWGIVRVTHQLGDRRDHFESMKDVWEMFRVIVEERKRREIDPTIELLRSCLADLEKSGTTEAYAKERVKEMLEFMEGMIAVYTEVGGVPSGALRQLTRLRGRLKKLIGGKTK